MKKLPRSVGAAAVAAAAVAAGALASACGSGVAGTVHNTGHQTQTQTKHQVTGSTKTQGVTTTGHTGGSQQGTTSGGSQTQGTSGSSSQQQSTTVTTVVQPPPVPQTITIAAPSLPAPTVATPMGSQLPASQIPWNQVGPGWTVAVWNPVAISQGQGVGASAANELVLVSPAGQAYAEDTFPSGSGAEIDDWSGNRQDVVLSYNSTVTVINLTDGETVSRFDVPNLESISFTHPDGTGLLIQQSHGYTSSVLARTNMEGRVELTFPSTVGTGLYTSDGTQMVLAADGGLDVVTNSGSAIATLPVKGAASCNPVSWWGPGQVVADCGVGITADDYVVSLSGAAPVMLGTAINMRPFNQVVRVGGTVFANMGACSTIQLMKLVNGQWQLENIPGAVSGSSQIIDGSYDGMLEVNATPSCGESQLQQPALFWYNPTTNTSSLFFGSSHGGGVVYGALGFDAYPQTTDLPIA
jgi:hypothetical protein